MRKESPWTNGDYEPHVADLLSDPIAQALMRADGITVKDVLAAISSFTRRSDPP
jgi:hypothetical protein